jgi:hypothetical protein
VVKLIYKINAHIRFCVFTGVHILLFETTNSLKYRQMVGEYTQTDNVFREEVAGASNMSQKSRS